ncbi:MAG: hypothetical protein KAI80_06805 [Hyphomicrobiaceae bacterium]|nr:hypothetical protein [Hyphomicrobiaceae bacterium]
MAWPEPRADRADCPKIEWRQENSIVSCWPIATVRCEAPSRQPRLESGQRRIDVLEFLELSEILGFDAAEAVETIKLGKTLKTKK